MFGGLIAYNGTVSALEPLPQGGARLRVRCEGVKGEKPEPKDSIAVNGVCLTVTDLYGDSIAFDVIPETLARTNLGTLRQGDVTNVEYSLRVGDRMGGHFVYGHVDAAAKIISRVAEGQGVRLRIERPEGLAPMLTEKAFVAIDGVSITIAAAREGWFEIALIPETLARTTFGRRMVGDRVNLEVDPIARYAVAAVAAR
jgi:riboflavin synthase alpha subunit